MSFKSGSYMNTNATPPFPRISANSSRQLGAPSTGRSDKSRHSRVRQIILSNKKSLNNAVDALVNKHQLVLPEQTSSETFSSFAKMPQLETTQVYSFGSKGHMSTTETTMIKSPFKQALKGSRQPTKATIIAQNQNNSSSSSERLNGSNSAKSLLKPITAGMGQFQQFNIYNPSTSLIIKTANSINEFVDFFEKNRNNTTQMHRPRGIRLSRYAGLKPLNTVSRVEGPQIQDCLGVVIEPKEVDNTLQLKELYFQKLKQLEQKREKEARGQVHNTEVNSLVDSNIIVYSPTMYNHRLDPIEDRIYNMKMSASPELD